jgi:DNA-binding CsgD family transcriptional regulator
MSATTTKRSPAPTKAAAAAPSVPLSSAEKVFGLTAAAAQERHLLLTPREAQVAALMADAKPNRAIAEELGISVKTLDIHRANLMHKLEARTTADVANLVNLVRLAGLAGA